MNSIKLLTRRFEIEFSDYSTLLEGKPSQNLLESDIFKVYKKEYEQWTEIKNLKKQKSFKDMSEQEQEEELQKRFLNYVCNSEKDKLYYFLSNKNISGILIKVLSYNTLIL